MTAVPENQQVNTLSQQSGGWYWILLIPLAGALSGAGFYLYQYTQLFESPYLVGTAAFLFASVAGLSGFLLYRRYKLPGLVLLCTAVFLLYGALVWLHPDGLLLSLLAGVLLLLLIYTLLQPPYEWSVLPVAITFALALWSLARFVPGGEISLQRQPVLFNLQVALAVGFALLLGLALLNRLRMTSLRYRVLTSYILLAIIPISLLGIAAIYLVRQTATTYAQEVLTGNVMGKASQIQFWLQDLGTALQHEITRGSDSGSLLPVLENSNATAEYQAAYRLQRQHLLNSVNLERQFQELFILDSRGTVVLSTQAVNEGKLLFNEDFFRTGLQRTYLQVDQSGTASDPFEIIVAAPIQGSSGRSIGVIVGRSDSENIRRLIESGVTRASDEIYLLAADHTLLTPFRAAQAPEPGSEITNEQLQTTVGPGAVGTTVLDNVFGEPVVVAYRWIPVLNATLLNERSLGTIYLASNQFALLSVGLMFVTLVLTVIAGIVITRSITRPITELDETASSIAAGATHLRASVRGRDEVSHLASSFNKMTDRMEELIESLEERVEERTQEAQKRSAQLAAAAELGSSIATIHNLEQLLKQTTNLISEKFGYYHCGIFLLDERGEFAVLQAANSEGGQRMLARRHQLAVGQTGIVGYVTGHGQARIALDVGLDAVFFDNPDLPETRSEMALPLIARGELLGALDVQSVDPAAFTEEDVEVLQLLADLIAVAIQNAQTMTRTYEALEAAQAAYGQFVQQAWNEKIRSQPDLGFLSAAQFSGQTAEQWHPQSLEAYQTGKTVRGNGGVHRLAIPIKVRNAVIGVIDTYKPLESGDWTSEEISMLENILSQLGIALESARLYEETRLQAEAERLLAQISTHMRATLDIDYVLQTAAQDLLQTLELAEVEIRLESDRPSTDQEDRSDV